jgi:hypothetical protein
MDRSELEAIFYGEGSTPPPWATDCPVRFDTWLAFAQIDKKERNDILEGNLPERRVDLILTINAEHGVRRVLDHLARPEFQELVQNAQPIASGSFVVARLTMAELVRAVLPLTNLYTVIRQAQSMSPDALSELLLSLAKSDTIDADTLPPETPDDPPERSVERGEQFRWFLHVFAKVAGSAGVGLGAAVLILQTAVLEAQMTQPPRAAGSEVIDRRRRYPVITITRNRPVSECATRSRATIKADAAEQLFKVDCSGVGWAIIDSGIDAEHPAFYDWDTSTHQPTRLTSRIVAAYDLVNAREVLVADTLNNGRIDWMMALPFVEMQVPGRYEATMAMNQYKPVSNRHGTHVAGVLGGWWPERYFQGICPRIRLYDFRVLGPDGKGDEFSIVTALQAVRHINDQAGRLVIAGVNLSLSVPHDVAAHSCGWTPVCVECDRLVHSGVVVVAAAGNTAFTGTTKTLGADYHTVSISDPGNTESVITVGSTHRSDPHRHGISYFSSRGPTADGRQKPDLIAPGEDIDGPVPGGGIAAMHGTSQAAAHVSGAAAMLISRYHELLGRPDRIKEILCSTATDLGRERAFQGNGLTDVLRAMQSI